ncbi:hypothetical protein [Adhaeribacter rhizoryzae]|uniref:Uncharacterized protein n=1 Tax=Adhaeribacter rhizoryzae TaxID=2607907 RepID=A0A5M6D3A7_9BACT|nr:hypothetical protein [Adhaeribacter rhizoryzae]KAA5539655.1 hypothetical protein F0145_24010 [Adhaeribacter rhizoryzae]
MVSLLLQKQPEYINFKELLEPFINLLAPFLIIGLLIWGFRRLFLKASNFRKPIIIHHHPNPASASTVPSEVQPLGEVDYSITPADPRFKNLPWEHKEALYINRIRQLKAKCQALQERLDAAAMK